MVPARLAALPLVLAIGASLAVSLASAGPARADGPLPCADVIPPESARRLFAALGGGAPDDGCALAGVSTERTRILVRWSKRGSASLPAATVASAACSPGGSTGGSRLAAVVPAELRAACPSEVATMERVVATTALEVVQLATVDPGVSLAPDGPADAALRATTSGALVLSVVVFMGLLIDALRRARRSIEGRAWLGAAAVLFALALMVRLATPASLANWYTVTLPLEGRMSSARFGPGAEIWQQGLRALFPWNEGTLVLSQRLLGAAVIPLSIGLFRALAVPLPAAAATGVLLALAPLHVRISSSPSEHVLAAALATALMLLWARGVRERSAVSLLACLPVAVAMVATRADMVVFAACAIVWTPTAEDAEPFGGPGQRRVVGLLALYAAVWAAIAAAVYVTVVLPSGHPAAGLIDMINAAPYLLVQYPVDALRSPRWYSPAAVALAIPGLVVLGRGRRRLLAQILATLVLAFVPLARNLDHDGLLGARYFLATLPFSLLPAGFGFVHLVGLAERARAARLPAWGPSLATPVGLVLLGFLTWLPALAAYSYRYTFQDEYTELHAALFALPDGCSVYALPVRAVAFGRDFDGSLDLAQSPLVLAYPRLRFRTLGEVATEEIEHPRGCAVYYEGAACSMQPTAEVTREHARALSFYRRECPRMLQRADPAPIWTATVSPLGINDLFGGVSPRIGLWWLHDRSVAPAAIAPR